MPPKNQTQRIDELLGGVPGVSARVSSWASRVVSGGGELLEYRPQDAR